MSQKKILFAIADGLGDRPNKKLNWKTPLEYANTPNLDKVASLGITGMVDIYGPGVPVGTDMGHTILFGNPPEANPGRGPIEALGENMDIQPGDIAFRCNFSTLVGENIIKDRRAGRIREGTDQLAQALNGLEIEGIKVFFKEATEHRAVLVLRGENLSDKVSDTDPIAPNDGKPYKLCQPLNSSPEAKFTAEIVNKFLLKAHQILKDHPVNLKRIEKGLNPANFIITRGAGKLNQFTPLSEKLGFKGAVVAGECTVLGVGRLAGYETITDDRLTGNYDTDIELKAKLALNALSKNDIVYCHFKATDLASHDKEPLQKVKAIEKYDQLIGYLLSSINSEETILALGADHSTPSEKGEHSGEPIPAAAYAKFIRQDKVKHYNEIDCLHGGMGRITGLEYIYSLLDYLDLIPKQGN